MDDVCKGIAHVYEGSVCTCSVSISPRMYLLDLASKSTTVPASLYFLTSRNNAQCARYAIINNSVSKKDLLTKHHGKQEKGITIQQNNSVEALSLKHQTSIEFTPLFTQPPEVIMGASSFLESIMKDSALPTRSKRSMKTQAKSWNFCTNLQLVARENVTAL